MSFDLSFGKVYINTVAICVYTEVANQLSKICNLLMHQTFGS